MVSLRSGGPADTRLLVLVWLLTLAVLGVGIGLVVPILIFWGVVGLAGAAFLTRIHVRGSRNARTHEQTDEEKLR